MSVSWRPQRHLQMVQTALKVPSRKQAKSALESKDEAPTGQAQEEAPGQEVAESVLTRTGVVTTESSTPSTSPADSASSSVPPPGASASHQVDHSSSSLTGPVFQTLLLPCSDQGDLKTQICLNVLPGECLGGPRRRNPNGLAVRQAEGEGREPGGSSDTSQAERLLSGDRLGGAPVCSCCTTRSFSSLNPDNYSPRCSVNTRVIAGCWNKQTLENLLQDGGQCFGGTMAEQKGGKVDSQNPGSNLHLAGPGETPTRPRLNRDQAQPFDCQSRGALYGLGPRPRAAPTPACPRREAGTPSPRDCAPPPPRRSRRAPRFPSPLPASPVSVPAFPAGDGRRRQQEERAEPRQPGPCALGCSEPEGAEAARRAGDTAGSGAPVGVKI
ncbi:unnamed protein product [Rangifer tarandus platyrhynchus]|uniref:Uncharacterized protein n=1 Tax=Rangifer tarandus platyrhynchus TaxID=3082113 RepID=A0ABN8Z9B0_RANTA|nr:unnamed protein product [Rangifer tarandus platyrhynchus]CAI9688852.1 unnamed protein product [Rangifer tarandus platyrhynchus]